MNIDLVNIEFGGRAHTLTCIAYDLFRRGLHRNVDPVEWFISNEFSKGKKQSCSEIVMALFMKTEPQIWPLPISYWKLYVAHVFTSTSKFVMVFPEYKIDHGHFIIASFKREQYTKKDVLTGFTIADPFYAAALSATMPRACWVCENPRYEPLRELAMNRSGKR